MVPVYLNCGSYKIKAIELHINECKWNPYFIPTHLGPAGPVIREFTLTQVFFCEK
jgi:hypothetical protein